MIISRSRVSSESIVSYRNAGSSLLLALVGHENVGAAPKLGLRRSRHWYSQLQNNGHLKSPVTELL